VKKKEKKRKKREFKLKKKNIYLIVGGVISIFVGFILLSKGSLVMAPILMFVGYALLIPIGIILK
jgi:ascorbate-specific PTS system EIIC-type component UlaA